MTSTSAPDAVRGSRILLPIFAGGLTAGVLDMTRAFVAFGPGVPRAIAGGLLGREAFQGGWEVYVLGFALHFLIAISAAAIYCGSSLKLTFLKENFVVCGLFFGIAIYLVMNLLVLPLSALHVAHPIALHDLIQGLLVHMFLIGLPISISLRIFSK
jgi:hypothetical protein